MYDLSSTMTLARIDSEIIPVLAICIGGVIAILAISLGVIKNIVRTASRERTRREVAAYVAEGSITPDDAERLLTVGREAEDQKRC